MIESGGNLEIEWSTVEGATEYKIYDKDNNYIGSTGGNTYRIENVGVGEYWYYITGVNSVGEGKRKKTTTVIKENMTAQSTTITVAPTASVCIGGTRLSSVVLSGGVVVPNVGGRFEFTNSTEEVLATGQHTVRFMPEDLGQNMVSSTIEVEVEVKTLVLIGGDLETEIASGNTEQVAELASVLANQFTDEAKEQLATAAGGEIIELNEEQTASMIANAPNVAEGFSASNITVVVPENGAVEVPVTSTASNPVYLPFKANVEYDMTVNGVTKTAKYDGVSTLIVDGVDYHVGDYIPFGDVMFYLGILGSPVGYPVGNRLIMGNDTTFLVMVANVVYLLTYNGGTLPVVWNGEANGSGLYVGKAGDTVIDMTGPGVSMGDNIDWPAGIIIIPNFGRNTQEVPCFPEGTRVLTNVGYKRVEELEGKDRIVTPEGRELTFKLYSRKTVGTKETAPYLIKKNAFGAEPKREIRLSPLHAIQSRKNVWQIPRYAALKNGKIEQYGLGEEITYYHIELPNYFRDNIVAEGSVVESFGGKQTKGLTTVYKWSERLEGFTRVSGRTEKKGL